MQSILSLWQALPSHLSPEIFSVGGFEIRWYGIMYLAAFACTYLLVRYRIKNEKEFKKYDTNFILDLFTWMILGLLIGARFGYALFYNLSYFLENPLQIFLPFEMTEMGMIFTGISGMSYHGGAIGVLIAGLIFMKIKKANFWNLADLVCPAIPLGYTFGRLGNFLNGELWGRATESSIGMYFQEGVLRHPSQLYEAFFEGIVLFAILWSLRRWLPQRFGRGSLLGFYLIGYGVFRFFIEYFREPDSHIGLIWEYFSMGQLLCMGMIILGGGLIFITKKHAKN
ncbi:prolipoprotein diacylglyceryl transferase [Candidatus Peregrinibacteria bacterium]|jgi:phosphatidylglycerol---prolipoprotein diacylglyceryl transferase|nr:prolipoprotein diacylglyceryl transferase [Candidatus Peregrinibacteria bacterium]